jgi:hypothetical protein
MSVESGGEGFSGGEGSGGEGSDFFQQYQKEMGETRGTAQEAASRAAKAEKTIQRLQQALSGDEGKEGSENDWYDEIMNAAFEAEKQGHSIPMTVQIATQLMDTQKQLAKATQIIQQLQQKQEILNDPGTTDENIAYSDIDKTIRAQLNQVYGGQESPHLQRAIEGSIVEELKDLQKNHPKIFQQVIHDESARKKMVKHFVMSAVPPKARQIVDEVREATAPITERDWQQAWNESQMIPDPQTRGEAQAILRQALLEQRNAARTRRR